MPKDILNEREFELVNIVGAELATNQRDLSRHMDLSLGMTNMLIRRLINKGYIRIRQLNNRKVQYMLTPKGFAEKMRKSVKYTMKTIRSIGLINERLKEIFVDLHKKGERRFYLLGDSDLATLVETIFKETLAEDCELHRIKDISDPAIHGLVLICQEEVTGKPSNGNHTINLVEELAKSNDFINGKAHQEENKDALS